MPFSILHGYTLTKPTVTVRPYLYILSFLFSHTRLC